jgi:hypothetical protein
MDSCNPTRQFVCQFVRPTGDNNEQVNAEGMNTYILDALAVLTTKSTGTRVDIQMDVGVGDDIQQLGDALHRFHTIRRLFGQIHRSRSNAA